MNGVHIINMRSAGKQAPRCDKSTVTEVETTGKQALNHLNIQPNKDSAVPSGQTRSNSVAIAACIAVRRCGFAPGKPCNWLAGLADPLYQPFLLRIFHLGETHLPTA